MGWRDLIKIWKKGRPLINIDFRELRELLKDVNIKFFSDNKNEIHHHYDQSSKILNINAAQLDQKQKEHLKVELRSAINADYTIIENEATDRVNDFKKEEKSSDYQKVVDFFKNKVSLLDLEIIRAALYIRRCFRRRENIDTLKWDVSQKHGQRGNNIVNLCTAGYFEDYLMPFFDLVSENAVDEQEALREFDILFNTIVIGLPFTIFVCYKMNVDEVKSIIMDKVKKNLKYGLKFLNIHGIGIQNIKKIHETILELEETIKIKKSINEKNNIIFVRLEFPD